MEIEMVGWHHQLNGHDLEQTPADREGLGSLACCSLWQLEESDTTQQLNNNINDVILRCPVFLPEKNLGLFPKTPLKAGTWGPQ